MLSLHWAESEGWRSSGVSEHYDRNVWKLDTALHTEHGTGRKRIVVFDDKNANKEIQIRDPHPGEDMNIPHDGLDSLNHIAKLLDRELE